ncbi:hypothetical protein ASG57_04320 [Bradyrhizobium sp. Leaf396]|nr:hypothetical protein ASG57_04320 [Bradyrhizobium sp. Leaf396]
MAADFRVACARFAANFMRLGFHPGFRPSRYLGVQFCCGAIMKALFLSELIIAHEIVTALSHRTRRF